MKRYLHGSALACAALLALLGCRSLDGGAKDQFAKDFSCPEDRVTVRPRADLDSYALEFGGGGASPPPEVQKDPARYAMWKKQQADSHASWNDRISAFEAKGCGHDAVYTCSHPNSGRNGAVNYADVSCTKATHQPPGTKG